MKNQIIKEIFQTSKDTQPEYLKNQIMLKADGWSYKHFTDEEIYKYFEENPMTEFVDIKKRFDEIPLGPHKADLFRYFYLYKNGGLFIDSDLSIEAPIDDIVGDCELMAVVSKQDRYAFNGLIYSNKQNKIIYECLKHIYSLDINKLKDYHIICKFLYHSLKQNQKNILIMLNEWHHHDGQEHPHVMYDSTGKPIAAHYWKTKVVPHKGEI